MKTLFDYVGEVVGLVLAGTGLAAICGCIIVFAPVIALFTIDK